MSDDALWPPLPYEEWRPTKQTLHRYTQIAGKIRMSLVPFRNHWWHVTLYVTARGLSTGPMPANSLRRRSRTRCVEARTRQKRCTASAS